MNASSFPSETFEEVTAHGLDTSEIDDLREWFCYTKPLGRSVKIVAMPAQEGSPYLSVLSAGTGQLGTPARLNSTLLGGL